MNDNARVLEDISVLTLMCHAKNDGPTLKIEESEIKNKISEYDNEIKEIQATAADDSYDSSAEMADRNIEIITKKIIQALNNDIKNVTTNLEELKEKEKELSDTLYGLKRTRTSYEKYVSSLKDRLTTTSDTEAIERYNNIIASTDDKIARQDEKIKEVEDKHSEIEQEMESVAESLRKLEERLEVKKNQLTEAQINLEKKEIYIDKAKKEKNEKRISELENKKVELNKRLEEIVKDPKYLEIKIKEVLGNGDIFDARNYLIELLSKASKTPYMDEYPDNALEEKLLEATKERDDFAQEIDNKTYDIMDTVTPEQIRVSFLNDRIAHWQEEIVNLQEKVSLIDKDETFNYSEKEEKIDELIQKLKIETAEFKEQYENESANNLSNKAILKITYEEKKADLDAAEEIASKFRKNEAEDAEEAGRIVKVEIKKLTDAINEAQEEIQKINERVHNRKSGTKDLSAKNKDREELTRLAQTVIDIKHRLQFEDRVYDIASRIETELGMKLIDAIYSREDKDRLQSATKVTDDMVPKPTVVEEPAPVEAVPEEPVTEAPEEEKDVPEIAEEVVAEEIAKAPEIAPEEPETSEPVVVVQEEDEDDEDIDDEPLPTFEPVTPDVTEEVASSSEPAEPIQTNELPSIEIPSVTEEEAVLPTINSETTEEPISIDNTNIPIAEAANEDIVVEQPVVESEQPMIPIAEPSAEEYNYSPADVPKDIEPIKEDVFNTFQGTPSEENNELPADVKIPEITEMSSEPISTIAPDNISDNA